MTPTAAHQRPAGLPRHLTAWLAHLQRRLSDRVHARGDTFARAQGWTVTTGTGRFGFGTRTYRDPRFGLGADNSAITRAGQDGRQNHSRPGAPGGRPAKRGTSP
jgi:hypothetical protein